MCIRDREVTTEEGCIDTTSQDFIITTLADPQASFDFSARNCTSTTELLLNGSATSNTQNIDPNSYVWRVMANNITYNLQGQNVVQDIGLDQVVIVEMDVSSVEGCTTTIRDTIQVSTIPFAPVFNDVIVCPGESAVLFTNTDPNTSVSVVPDTNLEIDNDGNYIILNNTVTTSYSITVDNGICATVGTATVTVDANPSFAPLNDVIQCGNNTIQLNPNGNTAYVYNWEAPPGVSISQSAANPTVSVPVSGTFQVTISTSATSDCFSVDTMTVTRVELPTIDILPSSDIIFCEGTEIALNGTSNGTLTWRDENGFIIGTGPGPILVSELTESVVYSVESVDQFGCFSNESIEIQFIPQPTIGFDPSSEFTTCFNESARLEVSSPNAIQWIDQNGVVIQVGDELVLDNVTEDTELTILATNDLGCTSTSQVTVEVLALPERSAVDLDFGICLDSESSLDLQVQDSVRWYDADGTLINTGPTIDLIGLTENTTYFIEYLNDEGCVNFDTVQVNVFDEVGLQINAGDDEVTYCRGFSPVISSSVNVQSDIEWFENGVSVGIGDVLTGYFPEGDQILIAIARDSTNCVQNDTISVNESFAEGFITGPESICIGEEASIIYNPNFNSEFTIEWTPSDFIDSVGTTIIISPEETTQYGAVYTNGDGCMDTVSYELIVGGFSIAPEATTSLAEICLGESVELDILNNFGNQFIWTPEAGLDDPTIQDPTATPTETTTYTVLVTDEVGRTSESSVEVRVIQPTCTAQDVFLPNMFTPNNDMLNDVFRPESNFIESMMLVVYDRWGEEIFTTTDIDSGWDGTFNGTLLNPDVYGYNFSAVCINGLTYQQQGNVTLVR